MIFLLAQSYKEFPCTKSLQVQNSKLVHFKTNKSIFIHFVSRMTSSLYFIVFELRRVHSRSEPNITRRKLSPRHKEKHLVIQGMLNRLILQRETLHWAVLVFDKILTSIGLRWFSLRVLILYGFQVHMIFVWTYSRILEFCFYGTVLLQIWQQHVLSIIHSCFRCSSLHV